jgi:hypothetical protein
MDKGPNRENHAAPLRLLARLIADDFSLDRGPIDLCQIERAVSLLRSFSLPLVYTAFDGDHLGLTDVMRQRVIDEGSVPVEPEAILGYKDLVDVHGRKDAVLDDDLSLLKSCDELWLFTDLTPDPESLSRLAEGALIELLFFLRVRPAGIVRFVCARGLLEPGRATLQTFNYDFHACFSALLVDQRGGVLPFLALAYETQLRPVHLFIIDPLDTKYSRWLRSWAYAERLVPLVPQLAVRAGDTAVRRDHPLDCLLVSWALLQRLAERG